MNTQITTIDNYIKEKQNLLHWKDKDIAKFLEISPAMAGQYRLRRGYNASLAVAKIVYTKDNVVLHPFSKESLEYEIAREI